MGGGRSDVQNSLRGGRDDLQMQPRKAKIWSMQYRHLTEEISTIQNVSISAL
jgi:hypothetical protein